MRSIIVFLILFISFKYSKSLDQTNCNNLVPGINRLGQGIDITLLDLYHDYTVDTIDGYVNSIIDFTCNENKTWISPFDEKTYQIPDQINSVVAISSGLVYSSVHLEVDTEEVKESMSLEVGVDFIKGFFSSSLSYKESEDTLTNTSLFMAQSKAFVSTTEIDYIPAPFLNQSLSKFTLYYYDQLPDKYEDDPNAYMGFLANYGTHYFSRGNFGGTLSIWFEIEKYLRKIMTDQEISLNVEATFLGILKAHGAYDGDVAKVSELFKQNSQHSERYFGGMANLFVEDGYKTWWPTVAGNPWLFSGQLRPITDLFPNGSKRDELIRARDIYVERNYLKELHRILFSFIGKGYKGEDTAIVYNKLVVKELNDVHPDQNLIEELGLNITDYIITPKWFQKQMQLCVSNKCKNSMNCYVMGLKTNKTELCVWYDWTHGCCDSRKLKVIEYSFHPPNWFNISIETFQEPAEVVSDQCFLIKFYYSLNISKSSPGWLQNIQFCVYFNDIPTCIKPNDVSPILRDIFCIGQIGGNSLSFVINTIS
jgi:hypothetical protein